jgi:predicted peptidase
MKRLKLIALFFILTLINSSSFIQVTPFLQRIHTNIKISSSGMPYRLCIPVGYNTNQTYPLVLFLHGAGERGTDNNSQLTANRGATLWAETTTQNVYPCFVVAPQCASDKQWVNTPGGNGNYKQDNIPISDQLSMVVDILDSLQREFKINPSKLYITGLSMGGYGTWDIITRFPKKNAAAIPNCSAGDPSNASLIVTLPIRAFASSDDPTVSVAGSRDMVNAINALGLMTGLSFIPSIQTKDILVG